VHIEECFAYKYFRKENEISQLNTKIESESNLIAQLQKKIKEQQVSH